MRIGLLSVAWALALGLMTGQVALGEAYNFDAVVTNVAPELADTFEVGEPLMGEFAFSRQQEWKFKIAGDGGLVFGRITVQTFAVDMLAISDLNGHRFVDHEAALTLGMFLEETFRPGTPSFVGWLPFLQSPPLQVHSFQRFAEQFNFELDRFPLIETTLNTYAGIELDFFGNSHLDPPLYRGLDGFYEIKMADVPRITQLTGPHSGTLFFQMPDREAPSEVRFRIHRLQIVPEPATLLAIGLMMLSLFLAQRRAFAA